jgi:hypothetical protein
MVNINVRVVVIIVPPPPPAALDSTGESPTAQIRGRLPLPEHHGAARQARGRLRQEAQGVADTGARVYVCVHVWVCTCRAGPDRVASMRRCCRYDCAHASRQGSVRHVLGLFVPILRLCGWLCVRQDGVSVRWDMGLNKKRVAVFRFGRDEYEARLVRCVLRCEAFDAYPTHTHTRARLHV